MSQIGQIITVTKQQLKARNITYQTVANHLDLSEASIKRLFSQQDISLARLEAICQLMDLELLEVMLLAKQQRRNIEQLTCEQEQHIVDDDKLMLVLICVLSHWSLEDILHYYNLRRANAIKYLLTLDQLGLIELLPNNAIKLRITPQFEWIPDGPIQTFFKTHLQQEFFNSTFDGRQELFLCKNGMLTPEKSLIFQREMRKLAEQFIELSAEDANQPVSERDGCAVLMAIRPWVPALFDQYLNDVD